MAPHRGSTILVLGILSWMVLPLVLGLIAWIMGNADLREMEAGRMDPSGRGLTEAGRILGMINVILFGVACFFMLVVLFAVVGYVR